MKTEAYKTAVKKLATKVHHLNSEIADTAVFELDLFDPEEFCNEIEELATKLALEDQ